MFQQLPGASQHALLMMAFIAAALDLEEIPNLKATPNPKEAATEANSMSNNRLIFTKCKKLILQSFEPRHKKKNQSHFLSAEGKETLRYLDPAESGDDYASSRYLKNNNGPKVPIDNNIVNFAKGESQQDKTPRDNHDIPIRCKTTIEEEYSGTRTYDNGESTSRSEGKYDGTFNINGKVPRRISVSIGSSNTTLPAIEDCLHSRTIDYECKKGRSRFSQLHF